MEINIYKRERERESRSLIILNICKWKIICFFKKNVYFLKENVRVYAMFNLNTKYLSNSHWSSRRERNKNLWNASNRVERIHSQSVDLSAAARGSFHFEKKNGQSLAVTGRSSWP